MARPEGTPCGHQRVGRGGSDWGIEGSLNKFVAWRQAAVQRQESVTTVSLVETHFNDRLATQLHKPLTGTYLLP